MTEYLQNLGEEVIRGEWRPNYVPKYKLWTQALMEMEEVNLRIITPGAGRNNDDIWAVSVSVDDLAMIAARVLDESPQKSLNIKVQLWKPILTQK
ncbi:MAG: hypothetical protein WCD76_18790 [Pyrinomonadaceae bacterium]